MVREENSPLAVLIFVIFHWEYYNINYYVEIIRLKWVSYSCKLRLNIFRSAPLYNVASWNGDRDSISVDREKFSSQASSTFCEMSSFIKCLCIKGLNAARDKRVLWAGTLQASLAVDYLLALCFAIEWESPIFFVIRINNSNDNEIPLQNRTIKL